MDRAPSRRPPGTPTRVLIVALTLVVSALMYAGLMLWVDAPDTTGREALAFGAAWAPMMIPVFAAGARLLAGAPLWRQLIIFVPTAAVLHAIAAAVLIGSGVTAIAVRIAVVSVFVAGLTVFQWWISAETHTSPPPQAGARPRSSEQR